MRFLDTDIQINSETIFSLLKPVIPSSMTTGLLCLAGGISYYSWNYYKNKKQELNVNFVQKNDKESEIKQIKNETTINDIKNIITNNKSNTNEKEEIKMLDDNNIKENEDEKDYDMLEDINDTFKIIKKENINNISVCKDNKFTMFKILVNNTIFSFFFLKQILEWQSQKILTKENQE